MDSLEVYAVSLDDYLITAEVLDDAISIAVELEHEVVLNLFEYPAEITVLSNKITAVEGVAIAAAADAASASATAATAQSSADAAMSQAEAATDIAASNTLTISNIISNFTAWVLSTYLGALTLLDVAIAAGESIQVMAGKLQGQVNAVKGRVGVLEGFGVNVGVNLATIGDYITAPDCSSITQQVWSPNFLHAIPFIPTVSFNCKQAAVEVTASVSNAKGKIFIWSMKNGVAFEKLYEGSELDFSTIGSKIDANINFDFDKLTIYYVGLHVSHAVTFRASNAINAKIIRNDGSIGISSAKNYIVATPTYGSAIPLVFPPFIYGYTNLILIKLRIDLFL